MTDVSLMMTGLMPSNKEYFSTVVINALLQILNDGSLALHHAAVVENLQQGINYDGREVLLVRGHQPRHHE